MWEDAETPADAERLGFLGDEHDLVYRQLGVAGHRLDWPADVLSVDDEHGEDHLGRGETGFGDCAAQGVAHAQASGTDGGECHTGTSRNWASASASAR